MNKPTVDSRIQKNRFARLAAFLLSGVCLLFSLSAHAALLKEFVFTGVVSASDPGVTGTLIGDTITGHFTYDYDTELFAAGSSPSIGTYYGAITEFSLKFGEFELEISNPGVYSGLNFVTVANDNPTGNLGLRDQFVIGGLMDSSGPLAAFNANIDMLAYTGTFHDTTLPDFLDASAFYARSIRARLIQSSGAHAFVYGDLTELKQISAVPLPPAILLFASTLVAVGAIRRRRGA